MKPPAQSHAALLKQAVVSKDHEQFFTVLKAISSDAPSKRLTLEELDTALVVPTLKFIAEILRSDVIEKR
jgi:hypothetical protein